MKGPRSTLLPRPSNLANFPTRRRYLIGVSGGRDSVALLHQLLQLGYRKLIVCHLDHRLRGRVAASDARFVRELARRATIDCEIATTDVAALARNSHMSIETAARVARFGFFVSVARRTRCRAIFLAHHADDLVETALLNLFRGASPAGVAAMREVSIHRIGRMSLTVVRPFLGVWRAQINRYVKDHALEFREDKSNRSLQARRNRIRHRVLPYIEEQLGRAVRENIWRTAKLWSDEDELLESLAGDRKVGNPDLDVLSLRETPVALQRRVILSWLRQHGVPDLSFDLVEDVRRLVPATATVAKTNLPRDSFVRRQNKRLFITRGRARRPGG